MNRLHNLLRDDLMNLSFQGCTDSKEELRNSASTSHRQDFLLRLIDGRTFVVHHKVMLLSILLPRKSHCLFVSVVGYSSCTAQIISIKQPYYFSYYWELMAIKLNFLSYTKNILIKHYYTSYFQPIIVIQLKLHAHL